MAFYVVDNATRKPENTPPLGTVTLREKTVKQLFNP
jgi:hypothetical protein